MKRFFFFIGFIVYNLHLPAAAQQRVQSQSAEALCKAETEVMTKQLALSSGQLMEVSRINKSYYDSILIIDKNLMPVQRKTQIVRLTQKKENALKKVVTAIQWQQYESMVEQRTKRAEVELRGNL